MAVALTRTRSDHLQLHRKFKDKDEETNHHQVDQKKPVVPVVYYLSRNGQLEHPHFIEVPLSSPHGLYLRDVINRLNLLRGKSMAPHYSWSSKRSYKSGYVWHDLGENDFIQAVHGGEYVLKGSEIQETTSLSSKSPETSSSSTGGKTINNVLPSSSEFPVVVRNRRRNQSWSSIDLQEYKVYKATESTRDFATAADASTQTDDKRRRRKAVIKEEPEIIEEDERREKREEISVVSPPPSDSSPETLETLMKADKRLIVPNVPAATSSSSQAVDQTDGVNDRTAGYGKMKASSVLMSLISCGSISFRDCGATAVKDHGLSLISHYNNTNKPRLPRGGDQTVDHHDHSGDMMMGLEKNVSSSFAKMALEDKEYFSGSLVETSSKNNHKDDHQFSALKRSSSYNADRSSHMKLKLEENEEVGVKAKCIPRRPRTQSSNKKGCTAEITAVTTNSTQDGSQN